MARQLGSRGIRASRKLWAGLLVMVLVGSLTTPAVADEFDADLQVTLAAVGAPPFVAGEQVTYTITVDNLGPGDHGSYSVSLPVPAGTTHDSGCTVTGSTVTCSSLGITAAEDPQTFDVTLDIGSGYVIANEASDPAANQADLSATAFLTPPLGRVDSSGNETIDADGDDCHFGLIGQAVDEGLGDPTDGVAILGNDAGGTNPCGFGEPAPSAEFNGMIDLNGDNTITADDDCEGCFFGQDVSDGKVVMDALFTGLSPTIIEGLANLGGVGVDGADDSNAFYGDTSIIDGALDCNAWEATTPGPGNDPNDGTAGDGVIAEDDDCTLIGEGETIQVVNGMFQTGDGPLPTVFNAEAPSNPDVGDSDFAWSAFSDANDSNTKTVDVIGVADLEVTLHAAVINDALSVDPLVPGNFNSLSADVTVTNNGPSDAADVTVTATYPTSLLDEASEVQTVGTLTAGSSSAELTFLADVKNVLRDGPYASTNTASVDSSVTTDDVSGNDSLGDSVDVFTVPDAPVLEDAEGGSGEIGVVWSRGNSGGGDADGGDDIVGYDVILTPTTGPVVVCSRNNDTPNAAGNKFSQICSGLTNGTTYQVEVVARNGAGASDRSNVKEAAPCAECDIAFLPDGQRLTMITGHAGGQVDGVTCEQLLKNLGLGATSTNRIVVCDEYPAGETAGFGGLIANVREDPDAGACGTQTCVGGIQYTSNVPPGVLDSGFVREVVVLDRSLLADKANLTFWVDGTAIGMTTNSTWCNKKPPAPLIGCVEKIQVLTSKTAPNGSQGQGDVIIVVRFNVNPSKGST